MGSWGITMRQSDYGLDLLRTIVDTKLKEAGFATFNVTDALEVIKADIMEEIRQANRGCSAADLIFYFSQNFPVNFTQGGTSDCGIPCRLLPYRRTDCHRICWRELRPG